MISLIVPVYNIEKYLERCVSSILVQTYKEYELILVDDGSTDGSSELCDFYAQQDSRIIVIHKENGGLVSARKAGLAIAKGEYIGFVDGDDWIEPRMYEHLIQLAMEYQTDVVLGGSIEDVNGQIACKTNRLKPGVYDKDRLRKEVYSHMLCVEDFFCIGIQPYIWNKLIRRNLAYAHMMTIDDRIRVGEDVAAVMPMLLMADKVVISDYCDYHYCIRGTSMMWQQENEEREWEELCILHSFLQKSFSEYQNQYRLENQLGHYTVMNMLTRTYRKVALQDGKGILWPFGYRISGKKCVVYSAGNFGRAVYSYLQGLSHVTVSLWVDRDFLRYQDMGLPVCSVKEIAKEQDADVLISVLDMGVAKSIQENLLQMGMDQKRIYCINITDNMIQDILNGAYLT